MVSNAKRKGDRDRAEKIGTIYLIATQIELAKVIFGLAKKTNHDTCHFCGEKIRSLRGENMFVLIHDKLKNGQNIVDHFFDINNVHSAHLSCCPDRTVAFRMYAGIHPIAGMTFNRNQIKELGFDPPHNVRKIKSSPIESLIGEPEITIEERDNLITYGGRPTVGNMACFATLIKRKIMLNWAQEANEDYCFTCLQKITDLMGRKVIRIGHKEGYMVNQGGFVKFYSINNLCFKHDCCAVGSVRIDNIVIDESRDKFTEKDFIELDIFDPDRKYYSKKEKEKTETLFTLAGEEIDDKKSIVAPYIIKSVRENIIETATEEDIQKIIEKDEFNYCQSLKNTDLYLRCKRINDENKKIKGSKKYKRTAGYQNASTNKDLREAAIRLSNGVCPLYKFGECRTTDGLIEFVKDGDLVRLVEVHHIQRREWGGQDILENLLALCPNCHSMIHQMMDAYWYYEIMLALASENAKKFWCKKF